MKNLTPYALAKFKGSIKRSLFKDLNEEFLDQIPDEVYIDLFKNFNNDYRMAWNIMNSAASTEIDYSDLYEEIDNIHNYDLASSQLQDNIESNDKILFITDSDNDGSYAQAGLLEFQNKFPNADISVEYSQALSTTTTHGFTVELVESWFKNEGLSDDEEVYIYTADNGINSRVEQEAILESFPNVKLIITDHHLPDVDKRVIENDRTLIFNPKYNKDNSELPEYWQNKNISGAHTLMLLLNKVSENMLDSKTAISSDITYQRLSEISNMVDYVDSDIRFKPISQHIADRNNRLSSLMNCNNTMRKIIDGNIAKEIHGDNINNDIADHREFLENSHNGVKVINDRAHTLLTMAKQGTISTDFNKEYLDKLTDKTIQDKNINLNYIEQLRPHIFYLSSKDDKTTYDANLLDEMIAVFDDLKIEERKVIDYLRESTGDIQIIKDNNSTIMSPGNPVHSLILNRKLLAKTFNEQNNGFMLVFDRFSLEGTKYPVISGSFRSLRSIYDILSEDDIADFESKHGLNLSIQGHDKAAGLSMEFNKKPSAIESRRVIKHLNSMISENYNNLTDEALATPIITNIDSIKEFTDLNRVTRGYLSNMNGVRPILKLSENDNIQDTSTQEIIPISEFVKKRRYGYASIKTTIDGYAVVLPVSLIHKVVDSDYKTGISLDSLSPDTFIGSGFVEEDSLQNALSIDVTDKTLDSDIEYYKENHRNNPNWTILNLEDIALNNTNIQDLKNTFIHAIDAMGASLTSIDFEAELGGSPKAFNIGVTLLDIDPKSINKITENSFNRRALTRKNGEVFLLTPAQISDINKDDEGSLFIPITQSLVSKFPNNFSNIKGETFILKDDRSIDDLLQIHNQKKFGANIVYNRDITVKLFNKIIKDKDIKLPTNLKNLTGISQKMIDELGENTHKVDRVLTSLLSKEKTVITAWNLPFDMRVIKANMPLLHNFINEKAAGVFCMAKIAKSQKMGYDDGGMMKLIINKKPVFFFNDLSIREVFNQDPTTFEGFLKSAKPGTFFESTCSNYLIQISAQGEVLAIDKRIEGVTGKIKLFDDSLAALSACEQVESLPKNFGKYSVPHVIKHRDALKIIESSIVDVEITTPNYIDYQLQNTKGLKKFKSFLINNNIFELLVTDPNKARRKLNGTELEKFVDTEMPILEEHLKNSLYSIKDVLNKELFNNYDFTASIEDNILAFTKKTNIDSSRVSGIVDLTEDFLKLNKTLVRKHRSVWKYKRVIENLPNNIPPPDQSWLDSKNFKEMKVLDDLAVKTTLPKREVMSILSDIINYKILNGLESTISEEYHRNMSPIGDSSVEPVVFMENLSHLLKSHPNKFNNLLKNAIIADTKIIAPNAEQNHDSAGHKQSKTFLRGHKGYIVKKQDSANATALLRFNDLNLFNKDNRIKVSNIPSIINQKEVFKIVEFMCHYKSVMKAIDSMNDDCHKDRINSLLDDGGFHSLFNKHNDYIKEQGIYIYKDSSKTDIKKVAEEISSSIAKGEHSGFSVNIDNISSEEKLELHDYAETCNRIIEQYRPSDPSDILDKISDSIETMISPQSSSKIGFNVDDKIFVKKTKDPAQTFCLDFIHKYKSVGVTFQNQEKVNVVSSDNNMAM